MGIKICGRCVYFKERQYSYFCRDTLGICHIGYFDYHKKSYDCENKMRRKILLNIDLPKCDTDDYGNHRWSEHGKGLKCLYCGIEINIKEI